MAAQLDIIIIGGSLSGLMCGVVLKHAGHNVHIVERDHDQRDSHMAGIGLGPDFREFLTRHDRFKTPFSIECKTVQDALYYRLRGIFDGYTSTFLPEQPLNLDSDGTGRYLSRHQVTGVRTEGKRVVVEAQNLDTERTVVMKADYLIGADGSSSFLRNKYCPSSQRKYAGYVAWRGTVLESELSLETRQVFQQNITTLKIDKAHGHSLVYIIPGPEGSLEPGKRLVNFIWYTNEDEASLSEIMIDSVSGKRHRNTVPAGHVRGAVWEKLVHRAETIPFIPAFLEIVQKIQRPFIQVITDFCSPQAAFEDGKVLLVGDAVSTFRPHTGYSGTQGAFDALRVGEYIQGHMTSNQWEEKVSRFSWLYWSQSIWWGEYYQKSQPGAIIALVRYWTVCGVDRFKSWWYGG